MGTHIYILAGVEEVKVDAGAGKVTVKGFAFDVEKLRKKVEKGCRKKVELIPPAPPKDDMVVEVKTKKEVKYFHVHASISDNTACRFLIISPAFPYTTGNGSFAVYPRHTAKPRIHSVKGTRQKIHRQSNFAECFSSGTRKDVAE